MISASSSAPVYIPTGRNAVRPSSQAADSVAAAASVTRK